MVFPNVFAIAVPVPGPYHCSIHPPMAGTIAGDR